jgi:type IV pilus assembly protein PilN
MSKINLLPWREERRKEQKQQFVMVLALAAVAGFGGVYGINMQVESQIAHQQARNEFVRQETTALDSRIAEIAELKKKRERLVDRMNVIQNLQGNRPLVVHVFDEIAKGVPEGVFFTEIEQKGNTIAASGMAESNTRISNLMRNLDGSTSFAKPVLSKVEAQAAGASKSSESTEDKAWSGFSMSFQIDPDDQAKGGEG